MGGGVDAVVHLAEAIQAPVCSTYLHNDSFPCSHPQWLGPLGYQGSKAAMNTVSQADVVLALGTNIVNPSFAELSRTMGAEGVKVSKAEEVGPALTKLIGSGRPGVLEIMVSKTLADPFRRDALSKPVRHLEKYKAFV